MTRDATSDDVGELARLLGQLGYPRPTETVSAALQQATGNRGGVLVTDAPSGGLRAFVSYQVVYFFEDGAPRCRITALAVDETARRTGLGRELLAEVERRARASGCTEIEVSSSLRAGREAAHGFYPAVGFSPAAGTSVFYSRRLGF